MATKITSLATFKQYFQELAAAHNDIQDFRYGDVDRLLSAERSQINYPCLWLEFPDIPVNDNGAENFTADMDAAFAVVKNVPKDDYEAQNAVLESTKDIINQIIARMRVDRRNNIFMMRGISFKLEPIIKFTSDCLYGWRVSFTLSGYEEFEYDQSKWNN